MNGGFVKTLNSQQSKNAGKLPSVKKAAMKKPTKSAQKSPVKKPKKTAAATKSTKKPEPVKKVVKPAPAPIKAKAKTPDKKPLVKAAPEKEKSKPVVVAKRSVPPVPVKKEEAKKPPLSAKETKALEAKEIKDVKDGKKEIADRVVAKTPDAAKAVAGAQTGATKLPVPAMIKIEPKIIETATPEYVKPNLDATLFSEEELKMFKGLLDVERRKILDKARKAMEEGNMQFDKNDMMDEVDQASAMIEQNLTFRLLDRDRKLLSEIDHAIAKLETGEYGYCEGTGEPIPKRRLELRPWCRHSVKYKEKLERMKKSGRGVVDEDEL